MNNRDHEFVEAELRRLKPAEPPKDFMARLAEIPRAAPAPPARHCESVSPANSWLHLLRWLAPATAVVALVLAALVWLPPRTDPEPGGPVPDQAARSVLKPDDVQIGRQWIAAYDALAQMPGGEPVRVRCQEWMDEVVLRDSARGVQIEQRTPRLEIVSVSLDTF